MNNRNLFFYFLIILILALVFLFFLLYHNRDNRVKNAPIPVKKEGKEVDYLIEGVSYFGFYNFSLNSMVKKGSVLKNNSRHIVPIISIISFWGDKRFDWSSLINRFINSEFLVASIQNFFVNADYELSFYDAYEDKKIEDNPLAIIKKYVNPEKKIPVLVFQKSLPNNKSQSMSTKVVIGIYDSEQKVVLHDYAFGLAYKVSYEDFKSMFNKHSWILAVWPSEKLKLSNQIGKSSINLPYTNRTESMDILAPLLINCFEAIIYYNQGKIDDAINLLSATINNRNFNKFAPIHRVFISTNYAALKLENIVSRKINNPEDIDNIIDFIETQVIPINNNLSKPFNDFIEQTTFFSNNKDFTVDQLPNPYVILGRAYIVKKDFDKAIINFEQALKITPDNIIASKNLKRANELKFRFSDN